MAEIARAPEQEENDDEVDSIGYGQKEREDEQARDAESLDARTTYEVIRREGKKELERSTAALFWSGIAAGLSMGFSFLGEALLESHLPNAPWRPLIASLGYTVGFLIVVLGSQQLFTENTLTPIIPLLSQRTSACLRNVLRLWATVFVANIIGAVLFAIVLGKLEVVSPDVQHSLSSLAARAMEYGFSLTLLHGVYAGWLIALMVWMLPGAETAKFGVIVIMTYFVALGSFAHVIAGASEVFYAAVRGDATWGQAFGGFILPALIGNVLGGLTMVAALNHAQSTMGEEDA